MKSTIVFACFIIGSINAVRISRQIVGGESTKIQDHPYQVSLRLRGHHFCGGTIISEKHILTAAHCITLNMPNRNYNGFFVHIGTSSSKEKGTVYRVLDVTVHPEWRSQSGLSQHINDIAILLLPQKIEFDAKKQKIGIATRNIVSGVKVTVTGWGATSSEKENKMSEKLKKVKMTLLSNAECQAKYFLPLHRNQACTYHEEKAKGACFGDSGGPIVADNKVVGIISWLMNGKCADKTADVITNVFAYKDFIESVIGSTS